MDGTSKRACFNNLTTAACALIINRQTMHHSRFAKNNQQRHVLIDYIVVSSQRLAAARCPRACRTRHESHRQGGICGLQPKLIFGLFF
jgi:hypothetical protein